MTDRDKIEVPIRVEALLFIILTTAALLLRINHLSADPPIGLSFSQGIYTDPAQYISYARNVVLWGSFNPLHDFRLVFFLKSFTTLVSYLVFSLFGVGYMQSNLVGLVFSFPTLVLFYFIVRRAAGSLAALGYLLFIFLDYNQLFFGRLSFLENGMNFFAVLSFTILIYGRRIYALLLSGLFLATGIFFGKLIGIIFIFPVFCFALYEYFYDYQDRLKDFIRRYLPFAAGFSMVLFFWYFFSYRPATASVGGYVQEQALSLYGTPEALMSFDKFIYNYVSFGAKSKLFIRMPIPALLCWAMMLIFFFYAIRKESWKNRLHGISSGVILMIAMVIAAYFSLMIWNYRPPRYQTMLIYPVCGLAGIFISRLLEVRKSIVRQRWYYLFAVLLFCFLSIPVFQLMGPVYKFMDKPFYYLDSRIVVFTTALMIAGAVLILLRYVRFRTLIPPPWFKKALIIIAIVGTLYPHIRLYHKWLSAMTFNTVNISNDIALVLSPEAVLSGPYAADLTQNNKVRNLIHMFGVAKVDSAFFRKYPITHLLTDKPNAKAALEQYPHIMKKATFVARYYMPTRPVNLYRIAGVTGNVLANNYVFSNYERAKHFFQTKQNDSGFIYLDKYLAKHPDNHSANLFAAKIFYERDKIESAIKFFLKAIDFSPTDFFLHLRLGGCYIKMYKKTNNTDYKNKAIAEFDIARKFNPDSRRLKREIDNLLKGKELSGFE